MYLYYFLERGTRSKMSTDIKKSKITTWKPKQDDIIVTNDGKIFLIYFEKIFSPEKIKIYDRFFIKKNSYEKQLEVITKYINFFMKFYDTDNEMVTAYLKIKFALDKEKRFDENNPDQLIDLIYELLFSKSIVEKISRMVEDNYFDDIESNDCKKYAGKEKKHLESLEFTNQHIKILLKISFGMKCISPILFHYTSINVIKLEKDSDLIYNFYKRLFDIFSDGVNMYNKLFVYVKAKVLESKSHNSPIFDQRDILGYDEYLVIHQFLKKVLISENIVKYKFNEHWDPKTKKYKENIIGFNKTIIKYQLMYFLKDQYSKNLTEVTSEKNADGLSGMDKMEMNMQKIDEGSIVLSEINIKYELKRIIKDNDFQISDEEVDYYVKNHAPTKLQAQLVYSYWCKNFGPYRNTKIVGRRDYIKLLLILKKRLLLESGHGKDDFSETAKLPYLLTGNLKDKVNTRVIRNNKFIGKIDESYLYEKLKTQRYSNLCKIRPEYIIGLLSQVINTTFTYVVYENQELLGTEIEYNEDKISDELLFFLNSI
jgi:hypothetical protein